MAEIKDLNVVDNSNTDRFPEGQAPSTVNDGARAGEGIYARGFKDTIDTTLTSTGTGSAYAVTTNRSVPDSETGLYDGFTITFKANHTNSTGGTTLTVTMLTTLQPSKAIVDQGGNALPSGVIIQDGYATVVYQLANDRFVLISNTASPLEADQDPKLSADLNTNGFGLISDSQDIPITPGGTGRMVTPRATLGGVTYPDADGTAGQAIVTDGAGAASWGSAAAFTEWGESAQQTWAANSTGNVDVSTFTPALTGAPKEWGFYFECIGASDGYLVGDKISPSDTSINAEAGVTTWARGTAIHWATGNQVNVIQAAGGAVTAISSVNFRLVLTATR